MYKRQKQCYQFCLVRLAKTHFRKVHISCQQVAFQFRNVIDFSYCDDGELLSLIHISSLGLGKTVKVGELSYEGLELINAKEAVVCAVK